MIHYFFTQKTPLIEHYNFFEPTLKRLDFSDYKLTSEKIILSTYFTSKKDPQRESYTTNDDFNYIKKYAKIKQKRNIKIYKKLCEVQIVLSFVSVGI